MPQDPEPQHLDSALKLIAPIISHEIRNPMAVIGNSSYFIKSKLEKLEVEDEKIVKHLGIIESEIRHANDIIGEILEYARMKEPAPKDLDLNSLVTQALQTAKPPKGVKLKQELHKKEIPISVDAELGAKSVLHVIRNAMEAAELTKGRVTIKTEPDEGKWGVLTVSDTGKGVPTEERAKLFTPFHTTKPRGVGLGLAFVRRVVALHKGTADCSETEGPGATFRIRFPTPVV